ncbi:MAG: 4Fe-4S dicluster domain-containing protein [Clostridia bacterium]|nr:4Fe-4S dicluster domain-containing protein [Clostridia bacterium]
MNSKKYPSGFKKEACQFYNRNIKKTSGISLSESDLFIDSSTLLDVYKAVVNQIPVITKTVHFSGDCLPVKTLLNVRIGTTLKDVINQLGGFIKPPSMVVVNGHLTGYSVNSLDIPVSKFVKSVSFVSNKRTPETLMYSCISCGNCRSICSRKLAPDLLYLYKVEKYALQEEYIASASTCSECGLCNTVCPSRIPLAQIIGSLKPNKILKEEVINEK